MNRRMLSIPLLIALTLIVGAAQATPKVNLTAMWLQGEDLQMPVEGATSDEALEVPERDLRIHVWHGREDDDPYNKSELLEMWFRTNEDSYVVVYRIDAEGFVEVLWPSTRFDDGFVYGGHSYSLNSPETGRRLRTSQVKGVEYVQAIASRYPFDLRELGIDFMYDNARGETFDYQVAGDPFLAVNDINYAITGLDQDVDYVVTDWTHLYVEEKVEYARYACTQCHVDESDYYHPYVDTCTQVTVRYDYGWYDNWYISFGWYPIYYDPLYTYWDYRWYRPYYYWYYPVCYTWPSYYWGGYSYYRPYRVYAWHDNDYYRGDYRTRHRQGAVAPRPLYPTVRGDGSSRVRDAVARRDLRSGSGTTATRGRDGDIPRSRGTQVASARSGRAAELTPTRARGEIGRGVSRTIRTERATSNSSGRRVVSQTPVGREPGSVTRSTASNRTQRRWTRPVVRNVDGTERSTTSSRDTPTTSTRRNWDRGSRDTQRDDKPDVRDRSSGDRSRSDDRSKPNVRDRKQNAPKDKSGNQRVLRSRSVSRSSSPTARRDATVTRSPRTSTRSGAVQPRSSNSRSRSSSSSSRPTVRSRSSSSSKPAPSRSSVRSRSSSSSGSKASSSRGSSVRSRGSSSGKSSSSATRGSSRSSGSRGSSKRGGRGRG